MTAVKIPLTQLPHQLPNMLAMATGGLRSYVPLLRGKPGREQSQIMAPPPAALLDAYLIWAGVDPERFGDRIPPHFAVSQMALAMISRLTAQAPYPLLSVLNQGVRLRMNAPLPRGSRITLRGQLADARASLKQLSKGKSVAGDEVRYAMPLRAAIARAEGDVEGCKALLEQSEKDARAMRLEATADLALYSRGALTPGEPGQTLCRTATARLRALGCPQPVRMLTTGLPGMVALPPHACLKR